MKAVLTFKLELVMERPLTGARAIRNVILKESSTKLNLLAYFFSLPILYALTPNLAAADEDKTAWGIGAAAKLKDSAYLGYDRETRMLPFLYIENSWMQFAGSNFDLKLGEAKGIFFTLRAKFALGDGYEDSDSYIFEGMNEREASIWVGPSFTWRNDIVDVSFEALTDSFSNSEGQQASLEFSKSFRLGQRFNIEPSIGATWFSDTYVDYYYGVEAAEARVDRPEYAGEASVALNAGLRVTYGWDQHQAIVFSASLESYDSEIKNSPLIDKSTEGSVVLGYLYRF